MKTNTCKWPPVPGSSAAPVSGGGLGSGGAGGAKNPRSTLRTDERLLELEQSLDKLCWDIMGYLKSEDRARI